MNIYDYVVLVGVILGIAVYGIVRTRGRRTLHDYLRGKKHSWFAIGLSVMATQASAVTFLSTPGQGYADGMAFVQNYFAVPLAMIIIAAFFLPIYRKLNVYTAYEYLGTRFDKKTRLLAAGIFLIQRGLNAGYTIYAPAIVLSTVFGWRLDLTILCSGIVCIAYTVAGGSDAVTHTQKYQFAIIIGGMVTAFCIILSKIPCSFSDALTLAGHFGKTNAVSFSTNPKERYTVWTGMIGGIFLMLSYFGTDQSQVQRYISGDNLRESRMGLMFNALLKIPMQFGILLLGVMLFVFYLFHPAPSFFNRPALNPTIPINIATAPTIIPPVTLYDEIVQSQSVLQREAVQRWVKAHDLGDSSGEMVASQQMLEIGKELSATRENLKTAIVSRDSSVSKNDSDYVFITFILDYLPHGLIGLLVACFFGATLNAKAAELNALTSCSVIDFYRYLIRTPRGLGVVPMSESPLKNQEHREDADATSDRHYVRASRVITVGWGVIAILFALFLFRYFQENLIQATNIVGSVFYGVVLGLFLIAFFIKFIRGTATFWGAVLAEALVLTWFVLGHYIEAINIAYLWYNVIGSLGCIFFAVVIQMMIGPPKGDRRFPVAMDSPPAE